MYAHLTPTLEVIVFLTILLIVTSWFVYTEMLQSKLLGRHFDQARLAATVFVAFIVSLTIFYVMNVLTII